MSVIRMRPRVKVLVFMVTLLVTASLLTVFTGCRDINHVIVGSGNLINQEMDFADFTKIEVVHAFQVKVTRSDSFFFGITVDDNLPEYLDFRKSGNTLYMRLKGGTTYIGTTKIVEITMPKLDKLSLSGASTAEVSGFRSSDRLELELSGASSLNIDDLKAGDTAFEVSSGSSVSGSIEISDGRFNTSGNSNINLEGYASDIFIEASEASNTNLSNLSVSNATVNISGASVVTINASGSINGDVSSASRLIYIGNPALTIETSGDSTLDRK